MDDVAVDAVAANASAADLFDGVTGANLDRVGVAAGWRCWEVGAGGPSVPRLLADRVGSSGEVVATDLDVGWMGAVGDGVRVVRHDVALEEPPGHDFDLVHARLVLVHVPGRDEALRRMISALRPGGVLLVEDVDVALQPLACPAARRPVEHRANRVRAGFVELLRRRGADLEYGRQLPRLFREAGMVDVRADAYLPIALTAAADLEAANVRQVRDALLGLGIVTADEVDAHLAAVESGGLDLATPPLVSCQGRRP
jgi:SAM-dependent methyltransferase